MTMASPLPPFIAAATQRRRQLLLQHRLDEAADAAAQTGLDRVEPSLTRKQPLGAPRCPAILVHGVVSPRASTPGFGCRVSTGDYVTPFPTTSRTGPPCVAHCAQRHDLRSLDAAWPDDRDHAVGHRRVRTRTDPGGHPFRHR